MYDECVANLRADLAGEFVANDDSVVTEVELARAIRHLASVFIHDFRGATCIFSDVLFELLQQRVVLLVG